MNKGKKLYEGKAKILYEGPEKGTAIQHLVLKLPDPLGLE